MREFFFKALFDHSIDRLRDVLAIKNLIPERIDHFALFVHHIVIFEELLTNIEVHGFDFALSVFNGACEKRMLNIFPFFHAELAHDPRKAIGAK